MVQNELPLQKISSIYAANSQVRCIVSRSISSRMQRYSFLLRRSTASCSDEVQLPAQTITSETLHDKYSIIEGKWLCLASCTSYDTSVSPSAKIRFQAGCKSTASCSYDIIGNIAWQVQYRWSSKYPPADPSKRCRRQVTCPQDRGGKTLIKDF